MKIYTSVGTHEQPFQRLLDEVMRQTYCGSNEWVVQFGMGIWDVNVDRPRVRAARYLTGEQVNSTLLWADVIVTQASPGNVFGALQAGVWPIVVGRQRRFKEHVDDHQVRFATALAEMGLATELRDISDLGHALERERERDPELRRSIIDTANAKSAERRSQFRAQAWSRILGIAK